MVVRRHALRLREPLQTSYGAVAERELLVVAITGEDGLSGYGEAAPLQAYDGVSIARVEEALQRYRPVVEGAAGMNGAEIVDACRRVDDLPEAFAAIDLALWDRAGRRAGRPIASLVTDTPARTVEVNATLSALDRAGAALQAKLAVEQKFRCLKIKVGVGDDPGRVAAVRAVAGPHVALRIDANGAWDVEQAVRNVEALAPVGLELVEEPVHGLAGVREVDKNNQVLKQLAVPMEEIKRFRQLGSRTPGHPESHITSGIETTTGPLGQGVGNSLGMAMASRPGPRWSRKITSRATNCWSAPRTSSTSSAAR